MRLISISLTIVAVVALCNASPKIVDPSKTIVYGSGLNPDKVVLPARYFYIEAAREDGQM